jgi:hypothetical protein
VYAQAVDHLVARRGDERLRKRRKPPLEIMELIAVSSCEDPHLAGME